MADEEVNLVYYIKTKCSNCDTRTNEQIDRGVTVYEAFSYKRCSTCGCRKLEKDISAFASSIGKGLGL